MTQRNLTARSAAAAQAASLAVLHAQCRADYQQAASTRAAAAGAARDQIALARAHAVEAVTAR